MVDTPLSWRKLCNFFPRIFALLLILTTTGFISPVTPASVQAASSRLENHGIESHPHPFYAYGHNETDRVSTNVTVIQLESGRDHGVDEGDEESSLLGRDDLLESSLGAASLFPRVHALRVEESTKPVTYENAVSVIVAESEAVIRLFGEGFGPNMVVKFVTDVRKAGSDCDFLSSTRSFVIDHPLNDTIRHDKKRYSATVKISLPRLNYTNQRFYLCAKDSDSTPWVHQGTEEFVSMKSSVNWLPLWAHILLLVTLLLLSGLFSGLNLGLMAMDITELKIIEKTGTEKERAYAKTVQPVRHAGNYLLCSILFGNVMFNSTLTILLDDITTGLIAVITSTLAIVIFGEILPQTFCSRHGLAVGAKTIYITKFVMCVTCPLSYPLSKLLDWILGEEIGNVYTRERLKELLKVTKDHHGLAIEEVGIISGALDMKTKTVKDIMVRLESVFMLPIDAVLDFETFAFIEYQGYSRIPVYQEDRSNIVGLLNVKQLTLLDANDNIPLKTVIEYYQNQLFFVFENARLDYMFRTFREGNKGHMAFVQQINDEGEGDPFYQTIGLVTFEDVLEELLQAEIMDESDIGKQEARLSPNNTDQQQPIKPLFNSKRKPKVHVEIPAPFALAAVQFLSTNRKE
ncbi:metal transporter CNNM4 [Folsomia candida]|uniref:metal transporter CNNM4 n=1 Tax=Folsomia candida TaxID=158441 RepID=UPI000B8FB187|nr:metal transporter CNNM4 [Folsomia candida]